jgi:hypothetical protein
MHRTRRTRRPTAGLIAGLVTALVTGVALAGCGFDAGQGESDSGQVGSEGLPPPGAPPEADEGGADQEREGGSGEEPSGTGGQLVDPSFIIYTGEIAVRVTDVDEAAGEVIAIADRFDGFVSADRRSIDPEETFASLELRIPSEDFTAAVEALGDIGEEERREIDTEDVRAEVVDLEARIATAQASVDRTRALLARAESIAEIVSVEGELTKREATLASLQARQRELADLTALSTITVTLLGPSAVLEDDEPELGFLAGLSAGWNAFTRALVVLVTVLGALLPWLVAAAVPATAVVWWARRRRSGHPVQAGPPPGT